jgi:hypothetical protein
MAIVASRIPPRLRDLAPHVPQSVAAAIEMAIPRAPADRFTSVTNLATALGNLPGIVGGSDLARENELCLHRGSMTKRTVIGL